MHCSPMEDAEEDHWSSDRRNASPESQGGQGEESGASTPLMGSTGGLVPYGREDSDSRSSYRMEMSEERRSKLREIEVC